MLPDRAKLCHVPDLCLIGLKLQRVKVVWSSHVSAKPSQGFYDCVATKNNMVYCNDTASGLARSGNCEQLCDSRTEDFSKSSGKRHRVFEGGERTLYHPWFNIILPARWANATL